MKLKVVVIEGKTYAVLSEDNKPIYVHDDNKEVPFDAPATVATISRLNGEAKGHREAKEAAETKLKTFEGITDPAAAVKALETIKNIDDKKLVDAGKVEEVRAAAVKAYEVKMAEAEKTHVEAKKAVETERDKLRGELFSEKIGGSFTRSKFIADKIAIPSDLVEARFGNAFKVEDGKIIAYDKAGNKVYSRSRAGEIADFDEALEILVDAYPQRDQILKGANNSGSGSRPGTVIMNGKKTITRTEFAKLDPVSQRNASVGKDAMQIIDG